jgi:sugar lactone lactonase YvrE
MSSQPAVATVVTDGLSFGEAPRWHDGRLWFSDFYVQAVKSCGPDGDVRTELTLDDDRPSGLGWLPDGRLLVVSMQHRRVLRREADGSMVVHADLASIATFHANDMVVDPAGRAYVGNFGFDLDAAIMTGTLLQAARSAALARIDPDGALHVAAEDLLFPNGTVITPDGATLIVAESFAARLTAFSVATDGSLSDRRLWAELAGRSPDGICLDVDGHVWAADALSARCVLVAEGGEILAEVDTGDKCYACMLGGADGRTLYCLTAPSSLARDASTRRAAALRSVRVLRPHAGLP